MSTSSHGITERLSRRPALSTAMSFRAAAAIAFLVFAANAAVSPLYRIYQVQFGFSTTTLTLLFAAYIVVLLLTLLFLGSVSDYVGRRPVMLAGLIVGATACGLFLSAQALGLLFAGRALQGVGGGPPLRNGAGAPPAPRSSTRWQSDTRCFQRSADRWTGSRGNRRERAGSIRFRAHPFG